MEGGPSAGDVKQMPAEFLEEMLDLRMRIEEVKQIRDPDRSERLHMELTWSTAATDCWRKRQHSSNGWNQQRTGQRC